MIGYYIAPKLLYIPHSSRLINGGDAMTAPKITHNVLRICAVFLKTTPKKQSGYGLAKAMDADSSTIWMALTKLEQAGWLKSEMERIDPSSPGRPPRRLYRMTDDGIVSARAVLGELQLPFAPST